MGVRVSSAHPHDMDPQGIEIDVEFGSAYWNQALKQLQWTCLNCDRSPLDYDSGVQMLRRAAKLDQRIKKRQQWPYKISDLWI